jgi:hypothetical protein
MPVAGSGFEVLPNPCAGRARILFASDRPFSPPFPAGGTAFGSRHLTVSIIDPAGRLVQARPLPLGSATGQSFDLDIRGLAPGAYFVRVTDGPAGAVRKLLVIR